MIQTNQDGSRGLYAGPGNAMPPDEDLVEFVPTTIDGRDATDDEKSWALDTIRQSVRQALANRDSRSAEERMTLQGQPLISVPAPDDETGE